MNINKTKIQFTALLIFVVAISIFNIYSFQEYAQARNEIRTYQNLKSKLNDDLSKSETSYAKIKSDNSTTKYNESVKNVLPNSENITNFNRQIEDFFNSINSTANIIELQDITYGTIKDDITNKDLKLMPFSINGSGTQTNFLKTIEYLTDSGDLTSATRLTSINKISVNWKDYDPSASASEVVMLDFHIEGNAYIYKTN